jgi:CheY-like chemotaxis protein
MSNRRVILIVDDAADLREILGEVVVDAGYRSAFAESGAAALAYLEKEELPCLILLDFSMPDMDGAEFLRHRRKDPRLAAIPVLVMSGWSSACEQAEHEGVSFLPKPVGIDSLVEALQRHCPAETAEE